MTNKREDREIKQIREKIIIDGLEGKNILDVDVNPVITEENRGNSKVNVQGILELTFILSDNNFNVETKIEKIPFEYTLENLEDDENRNIDIEINIENQDFIIQDQGVITSNIDMEIDNNSYRNTNLNVIDEIETEGERTEQDYSLIIYIVKKGDTLWNIAKKYGSTIENIVRTNGIDDENKIYPGQKLFIPRFVRMEINYE